MTRIEEKVWKLVLREVATEIGVPTEGIENMKESELKNMKTGLLQNINGKRDLLDAMSTALRALTDVERIPR